MAVQSIVRASIALGLLLALLWGVKHVDFEKVASHFPKDKDTPTLRGQIHKECPCKAFKERCTKEDGQRNADGPCATLWHECATKRKEWRGKRKGGFSKSSTPWWACKVAKTRCMKGGEKIFKGRCAFVWKKCEEQVQKDNKEVDVKDCYFDRECHKVVDWKKIGAVKEGIIARFKMFSDDEAKKSAIMQHAHELFKEAGMPKDRIDYILEKWAKYAEMGEHSKKSDIKPDAEGCIDKGKYGVWCRKGKGWYCKKNCKEQRADGCYDKGEHGVWCPKGDSWYCKENCKKRELKADADGCYDKGENGLWCPKDGAWYCKKNCEKSKAKLDADGCHDKGEDGVWCPKRDGKWFCKTNCKQ